MRLGELDAMHCAIETCREQIRLSVHILGRSDHRLSVTRARFFQDILTEGYDLFVVAARGDWVQVWRADGMSGWIERRLIWEIPLIDGGLYQSF